MRVVPKSFFASLFFTAFLVCTTFAVPLSDQKQGWMVSVDNLVLEHIDELEENLHANEALDRYESEYRAVLEGRTGTAVSKEQMAQKLAKADCVFLTDEHTVLKAQQNTLWVLEAMAKGQKPLTLVLEWIDATFQSEVDAYLRGEFDVEELKKRVRYVELWAFPWEGYRAILERARELNVPVLFADSFIAHKSLAVRDDQVVAKMCAFQAKEPEARFLVVYGAFHVLGKDHMAEKAAKAGIKPDYCLVGEASDIYWQALAKYDDPELFPFLDLGSSIFYIQNGSPVERHRSYRKYLMDLLGWFDDDFDYPLSEIVDDNETRFSRLWSQVN